MNPLKRWLVRKEVEAFVDNAIKESQMSDKMKHWLIGAVNVTLSGAATSLGSLAAHTTLRQGGIIVGCAVVMSFGKWFVQNPIPGGVQ